ncbi:MAG: hypothetical protein JO193_00120 [Candidatus Eremiobacteraeota bacterium]|nr:hypothetical protein [Candidatus Eremiobacteraeota bacterium]
MVGDYIGSTYVLGHPLGVFANANPPAGGRFDQATYASRPGAIVARGARHSSIGERPVPGVRRDPGGRPRPI